MIPKNQRISRENFEIIMKKGGLTNSGLFSLRFLKNLPAQDRTDLEGPENTTHFSVVVSKKVAKNAVLRNKIRRRGYSIFGKIQKELKNLPADLRRAHFIILFAKKGAEKATFSETEAQILEILKKAKIC